MSWRWMLAALILAPVLAGCGGGHTVTVVDTTTRSVTATPPSATAAVSTPATSSGTTTTATRTLALASFHSPSKNIGCMLAAGVARCDILHHTWPLPPRPPDCPKEVDFGQGVDVVDGHQGRIVCAGDTVQDPSALALPYGTATHSHGFTCASAATGITCIASSGHGFFLSAQSYRLF